MKSTLRQHNNEAVLFDMDGLMIDSESLQLEAVNAALATTGVTLNNEEWSKRVGIKSIETFQELKKKHNFSESADELELKKCSTYEQIMHEKIELMPGVNESIQNFKKAGFRLAVASSSTTHHIKLVLNKFLLLDKFDVIVSGEQVLNGKPDPEIFVKAAAQLKVTEGNCIVIEDTVHGVTAAKACGMLAIAIPNEFTRNQNFSEADFILKSLLDITPDFISNLS